MPVAEAIAECDSGVTRLNGRFIYVGKERTKETAAMGSDEVVGRNTCQCGGGREIIWIREVNKLKQPHFVAPPLQPNGPVKRIILDAEPFRGCAIACSLL